jgi:hypothetical protein
LGNAQSNEIKLTGNTPSQRGRMGNALYGNHIEGQIAQWGGLAFLLAFFST